MNHTRYVALAALLCLLSLWMLKDFLPGVGWGAILAVSLWPVYVRFQGRLGAKGQHAPLIFTVILLVTVLAPLIALTRALADLIHFGSSFLVPAGDQGIPLPDIAASLPFHDRIAGFWATNVAHATGPVDILNQFSHGQLAAWLTAAFAHLSSDLVSAVCMLIALHAFLASGHAIQVRHTVLVERWFGPKGLQTVSQAVIALRGTTNGIVLVGLLQGAVLALPLIGADIRSGLLLGLLAGVLGVIPFVTPVLILPCAGYLYATGRDAWALATLVDLIACWLVFENYLKPRIIGAAVKINPFLILAGLIGGLQLLGLVGLFVGPALISVTAGIFRDLERSGS